MRVPLLTAVICLVLLTGLGAEENSFEKEKQLMRQVGARLLAEAPPHIKSGKILVKARYAFTYYCNELKKAGITLNASYQGRVAAWWCTGDQSTWTCSHHANSLAGLFEGMGLKSGTYLQTISNIPGPNSDHGGLALPDENGDYYLFDAWGHALARVNDWSTTFDPYGGAESSEWNGMPLSDWESTMLAAGYDKFSTNDGVSSFLAAREALSGFRAQRPPYQVDPSSQTLTHGNYLGQVVWADGRKSPLNLDLDEKVPYINPGQYLGEYSGNTIRWEDEQGNVFTGQASGSDQVAGVVKYFRNGQWEQVGTFSASRK